MDNRRVTSDPPRIVYHKDWQGWSDGVEFTNNIVYNDCARAVYEFGQSRNNRYAHNLFFGHHPDSEPADPHKLTADPLFAGQPGRAGRGRASAISIYSLQTGSPARGAGVAQTDQPGNDFARRPLWLKDGQVDLGALAQNGFLVLEFNPRDGQSRLIQNR